MQKRKAVLESSADDSDLSPPPNDLNDGAVALANANADIESEVLPTKRRKTTSSAVKIEGTTEPTNGASAATQKRTTRTRKVKTEPEEEAASPSEEPPKPTAKKRQSKAKVVKEEEAEEENGVAKALPKGRTRKKSEVKEGADQLDNDDKVAEKPVKKKRKTKEEKEAEAMPLAARTVGHKLFIGAHVSSAGGQCFHIQLYSTLVQSQSPPIFHVYVQLTPIIQVSKTHH
jgi:hypothetical protein